MAWVPPPDVAGAASIFPQGWGYGPESPFTDKNDFLTYMRHLRDQKAWDEGGTQVGSGIGWPNWTETKEFWDDVAAWIVPTGKIVGVVGYNLARNPVVRSYVAKKAAEIVMPMVKFKAERAFYSKAGKAGETLQKQFFKSRGELATIKATSGQFAKAGADLRKLQQIAPKTVADLIEKGINRALEWAKGEVEDYLKDAAEAVNMAWFTRRRRGSWSGGYGYRQGGYRRGYRRGYSRYGGYGRGRGYGGYRSRYTARRRWY